MILILGLVIFVVHIPEVNAKDINFGWSSVEGWSSQPYEGCGGTNLIHAALMSRDLDYMTILPFTAGAAALLHAPMNSLDARGNPVLILAPAMAHTRMMKSRQP
jgi:hypothetical protein